MKFERIEYEDDPDRCPIISRHGQCRYKKVPQATTCPRHGAYAQMKNEARKRERMYLLNKWKERTAELSADPKIKDLREEIGIMRMMLEETLNQCGDAHELMIHSRTVTSCVDKIQKLVETVDKMESRQALPPSTLINLANDWVRIINVYVTDPMILEKLSGELIGSVEATGALNNVGRPQAITDERAVEAS